ncbi:MAG: hypothetical protein J0H25_01790 [Rhizobiales bacterium]|nr:hypothetical protein [Hyphomicrobiales bacterium]
MAIDEVVMVENDAVVCVKPVVPCDEAEDEVDDESDFNASKIVDTAPRAASMFIPYARPPTAAQHPVKHMKASRVPQLITL